MRTECIIFFESFEDGYVCVVISLLCASFAIPYSREFSLWRFIYFYYYWFCCALVIEFDPYTAANRLNCRDYLAVLSTVFIFNALTSHFDSETLRCRAFQCCHIWLGDISFNYTLLYLFILILLFILTRVLLYSLCFENVIKYIFSLCYFLQLLKTGFIFCASECWYLLVFTSTRNHLSLYGIIIDTIYTTRSRLSCLSASIFFIASDAPFPMDQLLWSRGFRVNMFVPARVLVLSLLVRALFFQLYGCFDCICCEALSLDMRPKYLPAWLPLCLALFDDNALPG